MQMLLYAHSGFRYLVILFGVLALGYALWGWIGRRPYTKAMRILASSFAASVHLTILLGFFLVVSGRFYSMLIGHIFLMLLAAAIAQITSSVVRRRPDEEKSYPPHVVGITLALALIVLGILSIGRPIFGSGV